VRRNGPAWPKAREPTRTGDFCKRVPELFPNQPAVRQALCSTIYLSRSICIKNPIKVSIQISHPFPFSVHRGRAEDPAGTGRPASIRLGGRPATVKAVHRGNGVPDAPAASVAWPGVARGTPAMHAHWAAAGRRRRGAARQGLSGARGGNRRPLREAMRELGRWAGHKGCAEEQERLMWELCRWPRRVARAAEEQKNRDRPADSASGGHTTGKGQADEPHRA
jgi:hypothetical protein